MPRDGSGGYNRYTPGTPYVTGTTISQTVVNAEMADLGNEVANSIAKDGQTVPTANLPMGGYKHTGVANGSARTHYGAIAQIQDGSLLTGTVGGTGDAITLTLSPAITAYASGQKFYFLASAANTGAATLNVNSLGAKAIKRDVSSALLADDIANGGVTVVEYDGTNFQLVNPRKIGAATGALTMSTAKILGRTTASTGAVEEISVGTGLSLSSGTLAIADGTIIGCAYTTYGTYSRITTVTPLDDTIPTNSEGDQVMSQSYTCASNTNRLLHTVTICGQCHTTSAAIASVFSGSTCISAQVTHGPNAAYQLGAVTFGFETVPGSTSPVTYSVRVGVYNPGYFDINGYSGARIFGGVQVCSYVIKEIKAS